MAAALREIGLLLALDRGNRFRARAYERGARAVETLTEDLASLSHAGGLTSIPGIGPALAATIEELLSAGRAGILDRLRRRYPPGVLELRPVLSVAAIRAVHDALGVASLGDLRAACEAGRLRSVRGFGEKTERRLLERIGAAEAGGQAVLLPDALRDGEVARSHVLAHPAAHRAELAGGLRRRLEAVDRLELVVASADSAAVIAHARRLPAAMTVVDCHPKGIVVRRAGTLDTHVRVASDADFPAAWVHATGSSGHVAALVRRAAARGLVLSDDGLRQDGRRLALSSEADLYRHLGLAFVPPELRDDAGEIDAAAEGRLPDGLLRLEDIQGAVHCHTAYSDGTQSIEEMARGAEALGLRYLTITDHSASATYAGGLDVDRLRRQWDEIARVQERVSVRLLRGTESDILRDGSLDYPDAVLERLDIVIASIHNRYRMDADEMTRRLVRAIRHPVFKVWGHALGRYVLTRPPFACHMGEVLDAVAASRAAIEVNGDPYRLDLEPRWIREARRRGIHFVVSTDAHSVAGLQNLRWGVDMARRGWLSRGDVLNTLSPGAFMAAVRP